MDNSQFDDIIEWATGGGSTGDDAVDPSSVEAYVDALMEQTGTLYTDESQLPVGAEIRTEGFFYNFNDLVRYLSDGALIVQNDDGSFATQGVVNILKKPDPYSGKIRYTVYIDDDTV